MEAGQRRRNLARVEKKATKVERKLGVFSVAREAERQECFRKEGGNGQLGCLSHEGVM